MKRLRILTWSSAILAALVFLFGRKPTTFPQGRGLLLDRKWLVNQGARVAPREHIRPPDQTFLTYPEWFLVFGPAEQADYFQNHTATGFPFMTHVYQIWESYRVVYDQIRGSFPFNKGYHVMILVIGTSSTVEFGLKAAYETLIGRLTDWWNGQVVTDEDRFNAKFAMDYVKFIETAPWYEFDFKTRLGKLWTETSLFGPHLLRKCERKYILTSELAVKWIYGWLIKLGTRTAYDRPLLTTAVVVDRLPAGIETEMPDLKVLQRLPDGTALITLPRYAPFGPCARELAVRGVSFKEIAGNTSAVLVTVLAPRDWSGQSADFKILFTQPLPTKPGLQRVALATPVSLLAATLRQLQAQKIVLEHVYDF